VKITGLYPRVRVDTSATAAVGQAGGVLLTRTVTATGLDRFMSAALSRWRKPLAVHDPGKVITDLALSLALGGDCLADLAVLRAEPGVYGRVASDPTVSRTISTLAADAPAVLKAIDTARAAARHQAWKLAADHAPDHGSHARHPLIIDLDATLVTSHSDKEHAAPTFKRGYGFHPLCAFGDHGPTGPVSRWRSCCAPATPARTPRPITSPWSRRRWRNCPDTGPDTVPVARSWSAPTVPAAPRR
jgi:Transposase DDE domain group 1